jgi:hypothetical protein
MQFTDVVVAVMISVIRYTNPFEALLVYCPADTSRPVYVPVPYPCGVTVITHCH